MSTLSKMRTLYSLRDQNCHGSRTVSKTKSNSYIYQRSTSFQDLIICIPKMSKMSKFVSKSRIIARDSVYDVY